MPRSQRPHEAEVDCSSDSREDSSSDESPSPAIQKPLIQRNTKTSKMIHCPNEEVTLLFEIIEFQSNKNKDVLIDIREFTEIINRVLPQGFSSMQLKAEILRIKRKFKRASKKRGTRRFSSDFKKRVFALSKIIWGEEANAEVGKGKEKVGETSTGGGRDKKVEKKKEQLRQWKQMEVAGGRISKEMRQLRKSMAADLDD